MRVNKQERIWEFDVDNTLIEHRSGFEYVSPEPVQIVYTNKGNRYFVPIQTNIDFLIELAQIGWYIRVHSGSGASWAESVVIKLGLSDIVDECCAKPLGRTDDRPIGDGYAYHHYKK